MLTKRIIPCLDVTDGRVVKGVKFENLEGVGYPPDLARRYEEQGADEVVFLDITASSDARRTLLESVERTAEKLFVPLTVGGGIRSVDDMRSALKAGADKVSINSAAVASPELIGDCAREFGKQCVVVAIDAKKEGDRWIVYTHGGRRRTELDAVAWAAEAEDRGAGEILLTSMDADGTTNGYDIGLTAAVADAVDIPVIASGGCGGPEHMYEVFEQTGASAALAASIFHYGTWTVAQVKEYLKDRGVLVR
ncbi:MAG: imidazole glycerol phosphate synthase subunit HisF [Methanomassiliicoccaceae archaeon]|jgi:cyclase|nr:imidazole glycerol phosphate synthase subunit HisF [Euryarchaeota archaeon]HOB38598.1 imidazole glycerol phosphate synthase subunit HisF [Methanomassiliicoccaceae archaeon]HQA20252.1 imidazole glycerol phosphate synthase subunit HisF [Methanomassiliicoccaceae archaeon]HQD87280.1 imidazole glycerol phosphate synthase subunit HisF [Methanomassiliicoccaceae archaeon]